MKRLPIHWQILGGFLALQVVVLAISLVLVERIRTMELTAQIDAQLQAASSLFDSLLGRQRELLTFETDLLGKDFAFKKALATRDPGTIHSAAANLKDRIGSSLFAIVDVDGAALADASDPGLRRKNYSDLAVVRSALAEKSSAEVQVLGGRPFHLVAVPIEAPEVIGAIVAGFEIDPRFAAELKRLTLCDVAFDAGGILVAATLDPPSLSVLAAGRSVVGGEKSSIIGVPGRRQIVRGKRLGGDVSAYLVRSWEAAIEPLRRLQRSLVLIGMLGFVSTALLGYFIAEGVTAAITRLLDELRAANETLTQLNGFQTKFFAMVTHDVRNPLSVVSTYTQLICAEADKADLSDYGERIQKSVKKIDFMISDLVDFASIENHSLTLALFPADVAEMVRDIRGKLDFRAKERRIAFIVEIPDDLPAIPLDSARTAQAIRALCDNALNFTPDGGTVTLRAAARDGGLAITVADTGIGIEPRDLGRLYTRFFQAENGKKLRTQGFGLGLKIARSIIEAHGGTLSVESTVGVGSTFTAFIPAAP